MTLNSGSWSHRRGTSGWGGRWDRERLSVRLFDVVGIRVFVHLFSIILLTFELLGAIGRAQILPTLAIAGMLFLFVLLHEFGHCFGCRAVGGSADEIIMWPLGGLAFCVPPHRPAEHLITVLAGPLVNIALCAVMAPFLFWKGATLISLINPFADVFSLYTVVWWPLAFAYQVNLWLFCFNVFLPVYPLDGGRILQAILWMRLGYVRSMWITVNVGMFASAVVGGIALYHQNLWIFFIMLYCFSESMKMRRMLEMERAEGGEFGYDFSEGYRSLERSMKGNDASDPKSLPRRLSPLERFRNWRRKREADRQQSDELEVDRILEKINTSGLASLTNREKRILTQASERQKKRRG